jgi:hypothetical protein
LPLTLIDFDEVEAVNLGYQNFDIADIGKPKVEVIADKIGRINSQEIITKNEKVEKVITDILILAVDSMEARKKIVENSIFNLVIDGRMGGEYMSIHTATSKDEYFKSWQSDEQSLDEPCGAKTTNWTGLIIGGLITSIVAKAYQGLDIPKELHFTTQNYDMFKL